MIGGILLIFVRLYYMIFLLCKMVFYIFYGGCLFNKKLCFLYFVFFFLNDFLYGEVIDFKDIVRNFRIFFNYRVFFLRGKVILMLENIYNVDL